MNLDPLSQTFAERRGRHCAAIPWTRAQGLILVLGAIMVGLALWRWPVPVWTGISYAAALWFALWMGLRLGAAALSVIANPAMKIAPRTIAEMPEDGLPVYTILVPLYREPEVVPELLKAMRALDYPTDKLDLHFLLEPDDELTRQAFEAAGLDDWMRITLAPHGDPRTKPRACNTALQQATGDYLVIFDAEDRPEADQLKKAVAAYRILPDKVACLQCRLTHYNSRQSLASRWAAIDYLNWFGWFLPGLQRLGGPLPLGGTSNHFRMTVLKGLDGWDPFNVTEDADLGVRLARNGFRTAMLDSATCEEAVTSLKAWVPQRSRWFKGYLQTWLVHMRGGALRDLGPWGWLLMHALIGGTVLSLLAAPLFWAVIVAWLVVGWSLVDIHDPWSRYGLYLSIGLLAGNVVWLGLNVLACIGARRWDLVPAALATPAAWLLHSLAAWRGALQFLVKPFHWDKTTHGAGVVDRASGHRLVRVALATTVLAVVSWQFVVLVQKRLDEDWQRQKPETAVQLPLPCAEGDRPLTALVTSAAHEPAWGDPQPSDAKQEPLWSLPISGFETSTLALDPEADFHAGGSIQCDIHLPLEAPQGLRVVLRLCDRDHGWFQYLNKQLLLPGEWARVAFPLSEDPAWEALDHPRTWTRERLHHLLAAELQIIGWGDWQGQALIGRWRSNPPPSIAPGLRLLAEPPTTITTGELWQVACDLTVWPAEPHNRERLAVSLNLQGPDKQRLEVPGFVTQDLDERGRRSGRPQVQFRWRPTHPGTWTWTITGTVTKQTVGLPGGSITSSGAAALGVLADHDGIFKDGETPFWPLLPPVDQDPGDLASGVTVEQLTAIAAADGNWARCWLSPWHFGIEAKAGWGLAHGLGGYAPDQAQAFETFLDQVWELGLRLSVGVDAKAGLSHPDAWADHPYNTANGGPVATPAAVFTDATCLRATRDRLTYLVARFGHHPAIGAWELRGLATTVPDADPAAIDRWHRQLTAHLAAVDDHDRPILDDGLQATALIFQTDLPGGPTDEAVDWLITAPKATEPGPGRSLAARWQLTVAGSASLACAPDADHLADTGAISLLVYRPLDAGTVTLNLEAEDDAGRQYRFTSEQPLRPGRWTRVGFALGTHGGWQSIGHRRPFTAATRTALRRLVITATCAEPTTIWFADPQRAIARDPIASRSP